MKHVTASLTIASCLLLAALGTAFATPKLPPSPGYPNGTPSSNPTTGHHGAPNNTCAPDGSMAPGGSASANGSPFNPSGTAGGVYAGNPGTASLANSNSTAAVAQYDIACFH